MELPPDELRCPLTYKRRRNPTHLRMDEGNISNESDGRDEETQQSLRRGRRSKNVVQIEDANEGFESAMLAGTRSQSPTFTSIMKTEDEGNISNELDKRNEGTSQRRRRGRPRKNTLREKASEGSLSVDPESAMLGRTRSQSRTFTNFMGTEPEKDKGNISNELDKRNEETRQRRPRGRPRKNTQSKDASEGSMSVDPESAMLARTRSQSLTFTNFTETGPEQENANESDKRKRETQESEPSGRALNKMQYEDAQEGFLSDDPLKTMLDRTRAELNTSTKFRPEQETNEQNGVEKQTDVVLETKSRSMEESSAGDPCYKPPHIEVSDVVQTECLSKGTPSREVADAIQSKGVQTETININIEDASLDDRVASNVLFTKTYPLWELLETMEVLKSFPQQPHFRPLAEENEFLREGEAIGYMLSFIAAAEKTRNSTFYEPDCTMLETLDALTNLKVFGFDVQPIKDRLKNLLRIKADLLESDVKMKQVEAEIIKEKLEEKLLKSNVVEMTQKMREFEESRVDMIQKCEMIVMKKQVNGSKITALQRSIQETMEEMQEINLRFTSVAARPW